MLRLLLRGSQSKKPRNSFARASYSEITKDTKMRCRRLKQPMLCSLTIFSIRLQFLEMNGMHELLKKVAEIVPINADTALGGFSEKYKGHLYVRPSRQI